MARLALASRALAAGARVVALVALVSALIPAPLFLLPARSGFEAIADKADPFLKPAQGGGHGRQVFGQVASDEVGDNRQEGF